MLPADGPDYRGHEPADRPPVEVLVDNTWHPGELRAWIRSHDGDWWANVSWSSEPGSTHLDTVPSDRVRLINTE